MNARRQCVTGTCGRQGLVPTVFTATAAAVLVAMAALLPACSDGAGGDRSVEPTALPTTTTEPGTAPTPRASAAEALDALLRAEQAGDHATSYRLLDPAGREEYPNPSAWGRRRAQLPAVTGYSIEEGDGGRITAVVEHRPGLDPFIGLSAARERQTWTVTEAGGGYLLSAEPEVEYLLPPDEEAGAVVQRWAQAVQACDPEAAGSLQAVDPLFGASTGAAELCGSTTALATEAVEPLDGGPRAADLIAQYSTDVLAWARMVTLRGPDPEVKVVVAPIGESWQVVAVSD